MKYFPLTIVDDFFPDVKHVLDLAKKIEYQDLGSTPFPGKISKDVDKQLHDWVERKILSIFWDTPILQKYVESQVDFQKIEPSLNYNYGLIHHEVDPKCAVVVYLNDNPTPDSGTSFYKLKDEYQYYDENCSEYIEYIKETTSFHGGVKSSNYERIVENHQNKFEEIMRVQPKQNRMILYSPEVWHAQTSYGNDTRYTLRCFLYVVSMIFNNREVMFPLLR
tara:strand:+ start:70 stop:732 length:663 start_codon:yes stop_codon:yes gene_type:complete